MRCIAAMGRLFHVRLAVRDVVAITVTTAAATATTVVVAITTTVTACVVALSNVLGTTLSTKRWPKGFGRRSRGVGALAAIADEICTAAGSAIAL
jgi:hypothetical protein